MSDLKRELTTREYAAATGISVSQVGRLLRAGKIDGRKVAGKWMIPEDEVPPAPSLKKETGKSAAGSEPAPDPVAGKLYSVSEFAKRTYLTKIGVVQWLESGKLTGKRDADGAWQVYAENLDVPAFARLVRS